MCVCLRERMMCVCVVQVSECGCVMVMKRCAEEDTKSATTINYKKSDKHQNKNDNNNIVP